MHVRDCQCGGGGEKPRSRGPQASHACNCPTLCFDRVADSPARIRRSSGHTLATLESNVCALVFTESLRGQVSARFCYPNAVTPRFGFAGIDTARLCRALETCYPPPAAKSQRRVSNPAAIVATAVGNNAGAFWPTGLKAQSLTWATCSRFGRSVARGRLHLLLGRDRCDQCFQMFCCTVALDESMGHPL